MIKGPFVLCAVTDLPFGGARGFDPRGEGFDSVFAVSDEAGVRVFLNACPHKDTPMAWRKDAYLSADGQVIMCFAHGAKFHKRSGYCFAGPCLGQSLTQLPSTIDATGKLVLLGFATPPVRLPDREVIVRHISIESEDVKAIRLEAPRGQVLPLFTPGSHINLLLSKGLVRSYSLASDPADRSHYLIGVRLPDQSRGGAQAVHQMAAGCHIPISDPVNNFPLVDGAVNYRLLGAGIGITPLLSMAAHLHRQKKPFTLHYSTPTRQRTAFLNLIHQSCFARNVRFHFSEDGSAARLDPIAAVADYQDEEHLYVCGPDRFMSPILAAAHQAGWPSDHVHSEVF